MLQLQKLTFYVPLLHNMTEKSPLQTYLTIFTNPSNSIMFSDFFHWLLWDFFSVSLLLIAVHPSCLLTQTDFQLFLC